MLVGLVSELVDWILDGILKFCVVLRAERSMLWWEDFEDRREKENILSWICRGVTFSGVKC